MVEFNIIPVSCFELLSIKITNWYDFTFKTPEFSATSIPSPCRENSSWKAKPHSKLLIFRRDLYHVQSILFNPSVSYERLVVSTICVGKLISILYTRTHQFEYSTIVFLTVAASQSLELQQWGNKLHALFVCFL